MGLDAPAEARPEEWRERHLFLERVVDGHQNSL
jgi:hypothetical protein